MVTGSRAVDKGASSPLRSGGHAIQAAGVGNIGSRTKNSSAVSQQSRVLEAIDSLQMGLKPALSDIEILTHEFPTIISQYATSLKRLKVPSKPCPFPLSRWINSENTGTCRHPNEWFPDSLHQVVFQIERKCFI